MLTDVRETPYHVEFPRVRERSCVTGPTHAVHPNYQCKISPTSLRSADRLSGGSWYTRVQNRQYPNVYSRHVMRTFVHCLENKQVWRTLYDSGRTNDKHS